MDKKINQLMKQIIPEPSRSDYKDREWFSNDEIIAKLTKEEKKEVEERLIEMLKKNDDLLIPQTLVKMESFDAIPIMLEMLNSTNDSFDKIQWATFINDIKGRDEEIEKIAFEAFEKIEFIYEIQGTVFYNLIKFKSPRIDNLIKTYIDHKYFLVAHHAREVLNLNIDRHKTIYKRWWEFWK